MNPLENHVEKLFKKHGKSKETDELKAEILSNLLARKADLMSAGFEEKVAEQQAKDSMRSVDDLIDGNKNIYIHQYQVASLQQTVLYLVIAWVLTTPLTLLSGALLINVLLLCSSVMVGLVYLWKRANQKDLLKQQNVNIKTYMKLKRLGWLVWSAFMIISLLGVTAVYFGSNLWFSRPIHIDGPYRLGMILISYLMPLLTIVVPLSLNILPEYILKYEAGEHNEQ